jgi:hypothetical protein
MPDERESGASPGGFPKALVAAAATRAGRAIMLAAAVLLFPPTDRIILSVLLLAFLVMPARREIWLSIGSAVVLWRLGQDRAGPHGAPLTIAVVAALGLLIVWLAYRAARSFRSLPPLVQRHPYLTLHGCAIALILASWGIPGLLAGGSTSPGWQVVRSLRYLLPFLIWRCSYLLLAGQRGTAAGTTFTDQAFWMLPIYGGSDTPFGKGRDYLQRYRAETPEAVAAAQLGGLKLLGLSLLWTYVDQLYFAGVNGVDTGPAARLFMGHSLGLPQLPTLLADPTGNSVLTLWAAVLLHLVPTTLELAIAGHAVIGTLRMFGFDAPRNTDRPLVAQRVLDFWNRYYFYFKELMFDFFFLPTYLSRFRTRPRLRIIAAVMSAAFLGNFYYHFLRDQPFLGTEPPSHILALVAPRLVYTFLLGVGISGSMLRERSRRGRDEAPVGAVMARVRQVRRIAFVWLFYALIHMWVSGPWTISIGQRGRFFLALFGIRT